MKGTPNCNSSGATSPDLQPYKYNGKELDRMHGLDTYDYGARQYDPVLCRWDRMDPLCEKYYRVSPYAYCGNNPVNMIDADGREIWIYYIDDEGHEQSIQYFVGMSCCVDNPIAQIMVDNLNTMYTNESGKKVIDALISSKVNYGYKQADVHSDGGEGFFDPITNTISMDDVKNTLNFAEETFHMYQNENNQGGITDVNEVEAKLFSAKMNYEIQAWFDSTHGTFGRKLAGNVDSPYTYSMDKLFYDGYSDLEYKTAINNFFSGSLGGSDYKNKLKYKHGIIKKNPLIKSFLPAKFQ